MIDGRRALYSGCIGESGHYFWLNPRKHLNFVEDMSDLDCTFPRSWSHLWDGGILRNGKHADIYDGKVWAIPAKGPWIAFVWWDNSIDSRPGSNSAFWVFDFEWEQRAEAFEFAKAQWPEVVRRQRQPLKLQP